MGGQKPQLYEKRDEKPVLPRRYEAFENVFPRSGQAVVPGVQQRFSGSELFLLAMSDIATLIEQSNAIKYGKFKLSDGSLTDYYIDKYVFETSPDVLDPIIHEIAEMIDGDDIDVIVGPELGAVPLVTGVSLATGIDSAFIRKGKKHHGTQARVEGTIDKGQRVAVVEDVTTTGNTILDTAQLVEEVGGIVERLIVVVDRNEGATERISEEGFELEYLAQVGEDLQVEPSEE